MRSPVPSRPRGALAPLLLLAAGCAHPPSEPARRLPLPALVVARDEAPPLAAGPARLIWVNRFSAPGTAPLLAVISPEPLPPRLAAVTDAPGGRRSHPGEPWPGGPPYLALLRLPADATPGDALRVRIESQGRPVAGLALAERRIPAARPLPGRAAWPAARAWTPELEALWSRWVEHLFDEDRYSNGWRPLHQVVRRPGRNLLHGVMGRHEDGGGPAGTPRAALNGDCADVAYQLRAYFAWKLALPMRWRWCTRGDAVRGPGCYRDLHSLDAEFAHHADPVDRFNDLVRRGIAWRVHSGAARTLPGDEASDLYPIRIAPDTLVPGTIYVDGGGHLLVVTRVRGARIVAIDGHPDLSVTMRRFSDRQFFRVFPGTRTGGFKAFRPVDVVDGAVRPRPNAALGDHLSTEQYAHLGRGAFHGFVEGRLRPPFPPVPAP